jgi:hypothetical protein
MVYTYLGGSLSSTENAFNTFNRLTQVVLQFTPAYLRALLEETPKRCQAVADADGMHTRH